VPRQSLRPPIGSAAPRPGGSDGSATPETPPFFSSPAPSLTYDFIGPSQITGDILSMSLAMYNASLIKYDFAMFYASKN
jgi:hypothetical protein